MGGLFLVRFCLHKYSRLFLLNIEIRYNWLEILRFTMMPIGSEPIKISSTLIRCLMQYIDYDILAADGNWVGQSAMLWCPWVALSTVRPILQTDLAKQDSILSKIARQAYQSEIVSLVRIALGKRYIGSTVCTIKDYRVIIYYTTPYGIWDGTVWSH
jgi:hypothetical protein